MSSVTSDMTAVPANGIYAATKGAVDALTKAAAVEAATDGISVNALAFAAIDIPDDMFWRFLNDQGIPSTGPSPRSRPPPRTPGGAGRRRPLPVFGQRALRHRDDARARRRLHRAVIVGRG